MKAAGTITIKEAQLNRLFGMIDYLLWEAKSERMELGRDCINCPVLEDRKKYGSAVCDCDSVLTEQFIYG